MRKDPDNNKPGGVWRSLEIARRPAVRGLLLVKVLGSVASSMYGTTYPLVLSQELGLNAQTLGFFMSASSIAVAILGAFGMAPLVGFYGPKRLARMGLAARAGLVLLFSVLVGYAADAFGTEQALAHRTTYVCHASVLHALAAHVLATSLTTQTTELVAADEQGALLGLVIKVLSDRFRSTRGTRRSPQSGARVRALIPST